MKVARSFIEDLDRDADDEAIVAAITGLGRSRTMTITAEGLAVPGLLARFGRV
jgi:EAL domain-containing protein (putative c-di-GMP-specific phosphodiesterase class I)